MGALDVPRNLAPPRLRFHFSRAGCRANVTGWCPRAPPSVSEVALSVAIAVFARPPVPGRVKTRLSPALPPEHAARLYGAMLSDTLAVAAAAPLDLRAVFWTDPPGELDSTPAHFESHIQVEKDLGERLSVAAHTLMARGHRVILVGSDCPGLTVALLTQAIEAVRLGDSVVGAAADGGYWLLGLSREAPELFKDIDWSTGLVLQQTLARAATAGLPIMMLPLLTDLDTSKELADLIGSLAAGEPNVCGPHLHAALRALSLIP